MKKHRRFLKGLEILIIISLIFIIFILSFAIGRYYTCNAYETIASDYKAEIDENNIKIEQCEEIKKQLHITAEAIRKQDNYDVEFVNSLSAKWHDQNDYQNSLKYENEKLYTNIEEAKPKYIGDFKITYYCVENYHHICNNGNASTTATGTVPTPGRTIAVDPRKIPYGTKVVIDGVGTYIAEDTGGAIKGNRIDICVSSHSEALQKGVLKNIPVYIIEEQVIS